MQLQYNELQSSMILNSFLSCNVSLREVVKIICEIISKENRSTTFTMATASNKTPPLFHKSKSYSDWVHLVNLWTKFTDLDPTRQGPALVMSLEGKALDTILELDDKDISHKDGVTMIINKLNKLYKKDELNEKFEDLEKFENYKRSP